MKTKSYAMTKLVWLMCLYTIPVCAQDPTPYDGCCGTAPKVYEVEDYKVYIPNVITPNGDGINDAFYPICNKMIEGKFAIGRFYIYNEAGELIFARQGLDVRAPEDWGFKGIAWTKPLKPQITTTYDYTGRFTYTCYLSFLLNDGSEHLAEVEGEACVVRCDDDAKVIKSKNGCYFPIQGAGGIYNGNINPNEEKCIK